MVQRNRRIGTPQSTDQVKTVIHRVKFTTSYHVMSVLFTILYVIFTGITCSWWQRLSSHVDSRLSRVQPSIVQMDQSSMLMC